MASGGSNYFGSYGGNQHQHQSDAAPGGAGRGGTIGSTIGAELLRAFPTLARQSSIFSLTLDQFFQTNFANDQQRQQQMQQAPPIMGAPQAKPDISSMNMDEFLRTVWTADEQNALTALAAAGVDQDQVGGLVRQQTIQRQRAFSLPRALTTKTVEDVWKDIQQSGPAEGGHPKSLADMTLEEFLIKAGVAKEELQGLFSALQGAQQEPKQPQHIQQTQNQVQQLQQQLQQHLQQQLQGGGGDQMMSMQQSQQPQHSDSGRESGGTVSAERGQTTGRTGQLDVGWLAMQLQQKQQELQQQQQQQLQQQPLQQHQRPAVSQGNSQMQGSFAQPALRVQQSSGITETRGGAFLSGQRPMAPGDGYPMTSPGNVGYGGMMESDGGGGGRGRKRAMGEMSMGFSGDDMEPTVERRQKRMIKNRESAARSRARKQAYTTELEQELAKVKEEGQRLRNEVERLRHALSMTQPLNPALLVSPSAPLFGSDLQQQHLVPTQQPQMVPIQQQQQQMPQPLQQQAPPEQAQAQAQPVPAQLTDPAKQPPSAQVGPISEPPTATPNQPNSAPAAPAETAQPDVPSAPLLPPANGTIPGEPSVPSWSLAPAQQSDQPAVVPTPPPVPEQQDTIAADPVPVSVPSTQDSSAQKVPPADLQPVAPAPAAKDSAEGGSTTAAPEGPQGEKPSEPAARAEEQGAMPPPPAKKPGEKFLNATPTKPPVLKRTKSF